MNRQNPYKKNRQQLIYDNSWITVIEDGITLPNNKNSIFGKILFKQKAVGIVPLDQDNNVYLVGQYRYTADFYSWEIPMGGCEVDSFLESAKRELKEETGLIADTWTELMPYYAIPSTTNNGGMIFLATNLTEGYSSPEDCEVLEVRKLPLKEAIKMIGNEIKEVSSIAALLKAQDLIAN